MALGQAFEKFRPTSLSHEHLIAVDPSISHLLPEGGLRRGSTVEVRGEAGATSLALALLARPSSSGLLCAVVGFGSLGLVAASELGVELGKLALVPSPGSLWTTATATLLDALDVVVVCPVTPARHEGARNLSARARHRGAVLVVLDSSSAGAKGVWPDTADVSLSVERGGWQGIGEGHGYLRRRRVEVLSHGRRAAARGARCELWLPSSDGGTDLIEASAAGGFEPSSVAG